MLELKKITGWDCGLEFTSLGTSPKSIRIALGAADIDSSDPTHIVPRKNLRVTDAQDVWWVGNKANGGFVAAVVRKALSTSGFSLKTSKSGKGNTSVNLTGHVTVETQDKVPMEFYSIDPVESETPEVTE